MLQAAFSDGLSLDLLSHFQDSRAAAVIDVGGCQVVQALVVSMVVVVIDDGSDLPFQIAGQVVVFWKNTVLHCLMPPLDLALGLRMMRRTANVIHAFVFEIRGQIGRHIRRTVVAEQSRFMHNGCLIASRSLQSQVQRVGHIRGLRRRAKFPRDDVAAVIIEDRAEVKPAPTNDLEIGEVGLPKFIWTRCLVPELISRADHHMGRCCEQILSTKNAA